MDKSPLRQRLLECAEDILEKQGLDALSLRSVARAAGVSEAAPYGHFSGKPGLLAAVAGRGFTALGDRLGDRDVRTGDAQARLIVMGRAYVEFAIARPAMFGLMFGAAGALDRTAQAYRSSSEDAFTRLREAASACAGLPADSAAGYHAAITAWSAVHGLAVLILDDRLSGDRDEMIDAVTRATAQAICRR